MLDDRKGSTRLSFDRQADATILSKSHYYGKDGLFDLQNFVQTRSSRTHDRVVGRTLGIQHPIRAERGNKVLVLSRFLGRANPSIRPFIWVDRVC